MSNLHRHLAPISSAAWSEIDEEARRTFTRAIAGRRVVDMPEAKGTEFSSLPTGHTVPVDVPVPGVSAKRREVLPVVEVRVPFTVTRAAIDDVDRGSVDSDWQAVKDAAATIARAEDRALFYGVTSLGTDGIIGASTNDAVHRPDLVRDVPQAVESAMSALRLVGVDGPYQLLLPAADFTEVSETVDEGYPIIDHLDRLLKDGSIIWAPGLDDMVLLSDRGGDYELHLGQDLSIGYLSHDETTVRLYLQESFAVRIATAEASVRITAPSGARS